MMLLICCNDAAMRLQASLQCELPLVTELYHNALTTTLAISRFTLCFRGSLALASQLEGPTTEQHAFTDHHKAAYQRGRSQQNITCTRCKRQFRLGQEGGCAYHPGAMDYTCNNEGRSNERNIFDRYDCCQRTVLDTPGILLWHWRGFLHYCVRSGVISWFGRPACDRWTMA